LCCESRKDGVQAAYRNDQRQEYVNNLAYKHGTGLGTAPWYGVPGTAYDFGKSKSAGATYHTDTSQPQGYGYQSSVAQYHSQPSYGGGGYKAGGGGGSGGYGHGGGKEMHGNVGKSAAGGRCISDAERYVIEPPHTKQHDDATYPPAPRHVNKAAIPTIIGGGGAVDRGSYGLAMEKGGYNNAQREYAAASPDRSKVGFDGPAGYVSGRYEAIGYGYMY